MIKCKYSHEDHTASNNAVMLKSIFFLRHTCSTHVVWRNKKNYGILFHGVYVIVKQFRFLKYDNIFTDTDDSQDIKGREGIVFYPTLSLPLAHEH